MTSSLLTLLPLTALLAHQPTLDNIKHINNDVYCVASAIYYEARDRNGRAQDAVGHVVMNRTRDSRYPTSACSVVLQKDQFSWVAHRQKAKFEPEAWSEATTRAVMIALNLSDDPTRGATHFCEASALHRIGWCRQGKRHTVLDGIVFVSAPPQRPIIVSPKTTSRFAGHILPIKKPMASTIESSRSDHTPRNRKLPR